jgi:hypothetical protein
VRQDVGRLLLQQPRLLGTGLVRMVFSQSNVPVERQPRRIAVNALEREAVLIPVSQSGAVLPEVVRGLVEVDVEAHVAAV